jgi:hypothetical protein
MFTFLQEVSSLQSFSAFVVSKAVYNFITRHEIMHIITIAYSNSWYEGCPEGNDHYFFQ